MDSFGKFFIGLFKKKKKPSQNNSVNNPVTSQANANTSSPSFVTNVMYHYPPNFNTTNAPLAPLSGSASPSLSRGSSVNGEQTPPYYAETEWLVRTIEDVDHLKDYAVVGGYDYDGSHLWVIRTRYRGHVLPAKFNIKTRVAYVAWENEEHVINVFEVFCLYRGKVVWKEAADGEIPQNAVEGGKAGGEKLYIGRATHENSLIPGKIQPSHKCCYVTYNAEAHRYATYEVLCVV